MGKSYKEQATYDFLHDRIIGLKDKLLYGVLKYFKKRNFPKWESSSKRMKDYKTKRNNYE
jgi:hypothetical protein